MWRLLVARGGLGRRTPAAAGGAWMSAPSVRVGTMTR
jgi:hypothetical protein